MNSRIKVEKVKSPWGVVSYDVYVDGVFVNGYRYRKDAVRVAEERIARLAEEEERLADDINEMASDKGV